MKRFIGPLVSKEDLQKLQEEADKFDTIAIAVTNNRQCWIYRNNDFERLSGDVASQVADILNCSKEEAAMAIYERGNYRFKDEVEEEVIEGVVVEEAPTEKALEEHVVQEEVVPNVLAQTEITEEDLEEDDDFDEVEEDDSLEEVLEEVEDVNDKLEEIRNLLIENNNLLKEQNGLLALLTSKLEGMLI